MKETTKIMLTKVENLHDWDEGQTRGGSGTQISTTQRCRVCGLTWRTFSDTQNGISGQNTFTNLHGNEISLREASESC